MHCQARRTLAGSGFTSSSTRLHNKLNDQGAESHRKKSTNELARKDVTHFKRLAHCLRGIDIGYSKEYRQECYAVEPGNMPQPRVVNRSHLHSLVIHP